MRYLDYLSNAAFSTTPEGRRLFHGGGLFSRPRIVPDVLTEHRLVKRLFWWTILSLLQIPPIICLIAFAPHEIITNPRSVLSFLIAISALNLISWQLAFRSLFHTMPHRSPRPSLQNHFLRTSKNMSAPLLILGLLCSLIMIAASVFLILARHQSAIGTISLLLFGPICPIFVYVLILKRTTRRNP